MNTLRVHHIIWLISPIRIDSQTAHRRLQVFFFSLTMSYSTFYLTKQYYFFFTNSVST